MSGDKFSKIIETVGNMGENVEESVHATDKQDEAKPTREANAPSEDQELSIMEEDGGTEYTYATRAAD